MQDTIHESVQVMMRFLDVIIKQNEAFRFQTAAFVDTIWEIRHLMPNFEDIGRNIKDVYSLSFHVTRLLNEVRTQMGNPKYVPEKKKPFSAKLPTGRGRPATSNPISKQLDKAHKTPNAESVENKFIFGGDNVPKKSIFDFSAKKTIENKTSKFGYDAFGTPKSIRDGILPIDNIKDENHAPMDFDFPPLRGDSRRIFEDNLDQKSIRSFGGPIIEPSIYDENTFFKKDELNLLGSKEMSRRLSDFDDYSLQMSRSGHRDLDFNFYDNNNNNFGQVVRDPNFSNSISNHDRLFKKEHSPNRMMNFSGFTHCDRDGRKISKRQRGQYKICPMEIKQEAIRLSKIHTIKEASDILNIPEKNIKRWLKNGPERKKGAGRKTMDPHMETALLNWIQEEFKRTGIFPDCRDIKNQAKSFSSNKDFKASKGWCDKFMRRNSHKFDGWVEERKKEGAVFTSIPNFSIYGK